MKIGQKLWRRAQSLIPGGNMLISKEKDFFLTIGQIISKAQGCYV